MTYKGADGWDVDGFFIKPVGWQEGKKYPMILTIHGGPAGMYGVRLVPRVSGLRRRAAGPSSSRTRAARPATARSSSAASRAKWGGNDYVDVMNGVDAALAKYPWIDRERLGVTGGSYGGYLTNWIVGHTNLFKAAVTLRSISNFISDDGTRDGAYGHTPTTSAATSSRSSTSTGSARRSSTRERQDADTRAPLRQRLPRARSSRASSGSARCKHFGVPSRDRHLPAREPQPHAHRRAQASGREPQLAGLLVRQIPRRQGQRRAARRGRR